MVDLKSYTPSNRYTTPADGLVRFQNSLSSGGYIDVRVTDAGSIIFEYASTLGGYSIRSVFVKKGSQVYIQADTLNGNYGLSFTPYIPQ